MTENEKQPDVIIVGAGMSGLAAARPLVDAGLSVVVLDKGRGPGGRLATRRLGPDGAEPGRADHGAQFFTVRSDAFREVVERLMADGVVFEWSRGWSDGSLIRATGDGFPRYAARGGMNTLAKALVVGLDVRTNVKVEAISPTAEGWQLAVENDQPLVARALILTPPVPQSLAILSIGQTGLVPADREALEAISYAPCLCGLFVVSGEVLLPVPGALQRPEHPISWIADNQRKGISAARAITVHAGPESSRQLYDAAEEQVLAWMADELRPFLGSGAAVVSAELKRWRYALPVTMHPSRYLRATGLPPLFFAGDAFNGPRVEGAFLSGRAAAAALLDAL